MLLQIQRHFFPFLGTVQARSLKVCMRITSFELDIFFSYIIQEALLFCMCLMIAFYLWERKTQFPLRYFTCTICSCILLFPLLTILNQLSNARPKLGRNSSKSYPNLTVIVCEKALSKFGSSWGSESFLTSAYIPFLFG